MKTDQIDIDVARESSTESGEEQAGAPALSGPSGEEVLGTRIRQRRLDLRLTQSDIASSAGLTKSFVSQIERGVTAPSISTLRGIAKALDVSLFYFFQESNSDHTVVRRHQRASVRNPGANVYYELLTPDLRRNIQMIWLHMEPGQVTSDVPRAHDGEECAVVLEGTVEVEIGGIVHTLYEGDSISFDSGQPHRTRNVGSGPATIISAVTPPSF
ncbi:MAG: cupin domain-containing protein [Thermoleophilia bacterium]|nr:cupin domain-containing protein [Thermoleophilia bacterium]